MADEFIADLGTRNRPTIHAIEQAIATLGRYVVERSSTDEIALRFSSKHRRPDWPEDFTLSYIGQNLLLTIHSATKQERSEIIQDVESVLRQSGNDVKFETV